MFRRVQLLIKSLEFLSTGGMMYHKKTALALALLVGLATCQPPPVDFEHDAEYSLDDGEPQPQQTRGRAPGYHGESTGQQGVGPVEYDDMDDRQAAITSLVNSLITGVMGFVRPLLSNLGVGASNAILATIMRRRLALIPEARKSMSAVLSRPKMPSPTVRAL